ncbi:MAG: hypothetical protein WAM60_07075 [Candidatus Promineifilaceae bacterium]
MTTEMWVTVEEKHCELIGLDVALAEQRVFPGEHIPDMEGYRVLRCRCTADVACNLAGIQCQWAYTNPTIDQFHVRA